jgi:hypothetical protein
MQSRRATRNRRANTVAFFVVVGLSLTIVSSQALARTAPKARGGNAGGTKEERQACVAAYNKAQERAKSAHLRDAREFLSKCARAQCGSFLQQECTHLYTQLETDIPSVVPLVADETGAPHALVEVRMDGELLTSKLDGHALLVDPGKHEFTFSTDLGVFAKKKIMIVQGQRNRPISAVLHTGRKGAPQIVDTAPEGVATGAAAAAPEVMSSGGATEAPPATETEATEAEPEKAAQIADSEGSERKAPRAVARARRVESGNGPGILTYATAGVGVLGVTGYFLLNYWGKKDNDKLGDCASAGNLCPIASVDHIQKIYLAANISGGIGLAALATSAYLYYRSQTTEEVPVARTASTRPKRKPSASIQMVDVHATNAGAVATIGGSF